MEYINSPPEDADINDDTLTTFNSRHSVLPAYDGVGNRKASYIAAKLNADAAKLYDKKASGGKIVAVVAIGLGILFLIYALVLEKNDNYKLAELIAGSVFISVSVCWWAYYGWHIGGNYDKIKKYYKDHEEYFKGVSDKFTSMLRLI